MTQDDLRAEVTHLHDCVETLKSSMAENTALTKEVRDILATFRVLGAVAKWVAAIGAAGLAIYHAFQAFTGR